MTRWNVPHLHLGLGKSDRKRDFTSNRTQKNFLVRLEATTGLVYDGRLFAFSKRSTDYPPKQPRLMFDSLQDGLKGAFKSLRGHGKLTEANMRTGLQLVENSLLEADVSIEVVRDFMGRVTEQALGEKVLLSLRPGEQVTAIVRDELVNLLGPVENGLRLDKEINIIMMCGLQGSGKTTTCGKLAKLLQREKITPLLVAADLQRPAAIDQLHVLGQQLNVPVFSNKEEKDPVKVCLAAIAVAKANKNQVVILDTAGRLAIDEALMRVEKGNFGVCKDCGEPIAEARLNAIPWTRVCITCKEKQKVP